MDQSNYWNDLSRKLNIFTVTFVVIFGLIGHILTLLVYSKKRFRLNSSHVYLFCLAINDIFFLVIHFFEDTVRTFQDVYLSSVNQTSLTVQLFKLINISDKSNLTCILMNYFRYSLRFISAYIIVVFTLQRLTIVNSPYDRFKTKKSAWITVLIIVIISFLVNLWVLFMFEIRQNEQNSFYCDVNRKWKNKYFIIALVYILIIMLTPILIIFISNVIIVYKTKRANAQRENLQVVTTKRVLSILTMYKDESSGSNKITNTIKNLNEMNQTHNLSRTNLNKLPNELKLSQCSIASQIRPFYLNFDHLTNQIKNKVSNCPQRITRMLVLISFSYAILNLPYFLTWCAFFIRSALYTQNNSFEVYLFAVLQFFEIFYVLNYGIYFYINYASSSLFRMQLKHLCNNTKILFQISFIY